MPQQGDTTCAQSVSHVIALGTAITLAFHLDDAAVLTETDERRLHPVLTRRQLPREIFEGGGVIGEQGKDSQPERRRRIVEHEHLCLPCEAALGASHCLESPHDPAGVLHCGAFGADVICRLERFRHRGEQVIDVNVIAGAVTGVMIGSRHERSEDLQ